MATMEPYVAACAEHKLKPNAAFVQLPPGETTVDLSRNYLGTENGFDAFLKWLKAAEHVETLRLNDCMLTTDNVRGLVEVALGHPSLAALHLRSNRLFVESGTHLVRLARFNANMREIEVRELPPTAASAAAGTDPLPAHANHIPERVVRKMETHLAFNRRLAAKEKEQQEQ